MLLSHHEFFHSGSDKHKTRIKHRYHKFQVGAELQVALTTPPMKRDTKTLKRVRHVFMFVGLCDAKCDFSVNITSFNWNYTYI